MNTSHHTRTRLAMLGLSALTALSIAAPTPAAAADVRASDVIANDVIATDTTVAEASPAVAVVPTAVASRPRAITVTNHGGRSVTLFAKGERIRRVLAPGSRPATFTGLTAGRTYTVAIGGQPIGAVMALDVPAAASGLQVRATTTPGEVLLTWRHTHTAGTGGHAVAYDVTATAAGVPPVRTTVVGTRSATLAGLEPRARYTFRVVPRNSAGRGRASVATMTRSLAEATGSTVAIAPAPAPSSPAPTVPAASVPAPTPGPAPAPRPTTRTVWVCPDGYTETDGVCRMTKAYTYHEEVETAPYTYHSEEHVTTITVPATHNGTIWTWSCPSGYSDGGGQWGVGACKGTVTVRVKDAPPAGWYDTGSAYGHDIDVQDPMPEGYLDDGTQWVRTAAKIAREVPA